MENGVTQHWLSLSFYTDILSMLDQGTGQLAHKPVPFYDLGFHCSLLSYFWTPCAQHPILLETSFPNKIERFLTRFLGDISVYTTQVSRSQKYKNKDENASYFF